MPCEEVGGGKGALLGVLVFAVGLMFVCGPSSARTTLHSSICVCMCVRVCLRVCVCLCVCVCVLARLYTLSTENMVFEFGMLAYLYQHCPG